jgi:transcriptional regulator with XRE-family HTH domain
VSLAAAVIDELRRRMTARGMSQNELARAAGMPPTLVHRVMARKRTLSLDELDALAAALGSSGRLLVRYATESPRPSETASD